MKLAGRGSDCGERPLVWGNRAGLANQPTFTRRLERIGETFSMSGAALLIQGHPVAYALRKQLKSLTFRTGDEVEPSQLA